MVVSERVRRMANAVKAPESLSNQVKRSGGITRWYWSIRWCWSRTDSGHVDQAKRSRVLDEYEIAEGLSGNCAKRFVSEETQHLKEESIALRTVFGSLSCVIGSDWLSAAG
jgi:hypothetical protein